MEKINYELMYKRLEAIAKEIQGEDLSLDKVQSLYKEGMDISEKCISYIEELKREVEGGNK